MAVLLVQKFVKNIPIRASCVSSFAVLSNSIGNRSSLSEKVSLKATTDKDLNEILSYGLDPSVSREEICIGFLKKLCAAGNLLVAARLPQTLRRNHIFLGPCAYNCLLEAADSKNDIDTLFQVFKDLLVSCTSIRLSSYLIVGRAFGKHKDPDMLLNFIGEICQMELPRIDIVLNRFIFALAKCGHVDSALLIFDHLKGSKCKPDLVTCNIVLAIFGRLGRVDDMLNEFAFMKTIDLTPDVVSYNTILNSFRKMGRLDLCLVHVKEMSEKGIQPDMLTFKALIESLGRSGNIEEALKIFHEMKRNQISPSIYIYRALVFSLKRMGKVELASKLFTEMNKVFPELVAPRNFQYKNR